MESARQTLGGLAQGPGKIASISIDPKMPWIKRSEELTLDEQGRVELPAPNSAVKMCGQLNPPARDEIREEVREG